MELGTLWRHALLGTYLTPLALPECQEAALTRRIAWRRSGGGVGLGPFGKQLHPAAPELTIWRERPTDSSQQSAEQTCKRHVTYLRAVLVSGLIR